MVTKFDNAVKVSYDDYMNQEGNAGKVAVYNFDNMTLVAEGEGEDWLDLELLCEDLRANGKYRIIIVPPKEPYLSPYRGMFLWKN